MINEVKMMQIKYVYNEDGKISDVIVPIDIWNQKYCKIEESEENIPWDPSEFFGSIKHQNLVLMSHFLYYWLASSSKIL